MQRYDAIDGFGVNLIQIQEEVRRIQFFKNCLRNDSLSFRFES